MSSNTTVMNIPTNMVGIVENLMELGKIGMDWDVVVAGQIVGKMAKAPVEPTRSAGVTDEEIQEMLDKSKNAYNLFCAKNFREAEKENPDPANRKETYRILGPRWTALKNDASRYDEFRSYHVPYLKEDATSMSGLKWAGVLEKPKLRRSDDVANSGLEVPQELEDLFSEALRVGLTTDDGVRLMRMNVGGTVFPASYYIEMWKERLAEHKRKQRVVSNELDDVCPGCESGVDSSCAHCDEDGNYPHPNCVSVPEYSAKKERVVRIDEHNELMDDVADGGERGSEYEKKTWTCLVCTKQNLRGVYNCVCCGRIVGTVPEHPGLYWNSSVQVWDVPRGESKVKRGYNNYAYHYREHFKGKGFSKRNITRKISAGWQKKTRSEKEQWADWEWADAEMRRMAGWSEMRESWPCKV